MERWIARSEPQTTQGAGRRPGTRVVGAAERALSSRHRAIVEDLRLITDRLKAPYSSASAFRHAYDDAASRDVADTSAVAHQLGVLIRAMTEQAFGIAPSVGSRTSRQEGIGSSESLVAATVAGGRQDRGAGLTSVLTSDSPLTVPASLAAREKAEQGCRALESAWYGEAEELFCEGTIFLPTEPLLWFGAGIAASFQDPVRGAVHLERAGRYLLPTDPAGSAYTAILAAGLREGADDARGARRLLQQQLVDLNVTCPTISLHLARIGPDRNRHVSDALGADPMLDADLLALGIDAEEATKERRRRTERELNALEYSISELRKVDGGPAWPDETTTGDRLDDGDGLSLVRLEVLLWRKIRACESEVDNARRVVQDQERARRQKEAEVALATEAATADLLHRTAVPFFFSAVLIAMGVVGLLLLGQILVSAAPSMATPITVAVWLGQLGLIALAVRLFLQAWWPHRSYGRARRAKDALPHLEWEAAQLRQGEFDVRRRFNRASQDAELRIRRVIDRRHFLVPERPTFSST